MFKSDFLYFYPGPVSVRDENQRIIYVNQQFSKWINQYTDQDPVGLTNPELAKFVPDFLANLLREFHEENVSDVIHETPLMQLVEVFDAVKSEVFNLVKYRVQKENGVYLYTVGTCVTELCEQVRSSYQASITDALSGLFNRTYLAELPEDWDSLYVLIDFDNFKQVNDGYGHATGDAVIREFSRALKRFFPDDNLIRLGGDEFLIITDQPIEDIDHRLFSLYRHIKILFFKYSFLSFSFGYHRFTGSKDSTLELIDRLMYENKRQNKKDAKERILTTF